MNMTVRDFLGNVVNVDDYFAYPLTVGRSAAMAVYQFKGVNESGSVKAKPINHSYGYNKEYRYKTWCRKEGGYRDMTEAERKKVDSKTSTLHFMNKRAIKLENFKEQQ
jgi:hypothetical protein